MIPFGSLVDFMPSLPEAVKLAKFSPKAIPGVFLGYVVQPGGAFKGAFEVAALEEFRALAFSLNDWCRNIRIHTVRDVIPSRGGVVFPLKARCDAARRSIGDEAPPIVEVLDFAPVEDVVDEVNADVDDWVDVGAGVGDLGAEDPFAPPEGQERDDPLPPVRMFRGDRESGGGGVRSRI